MSVGGLVLRPRRGTKKPPDGGGVSGEADAVKEWDWTASLVHEPLVGFLEDSLTGETVLCQDGVHPAFGGCGLVAAAPKLNPALADLSDFVTIEIDTCNAFCVMGDLGVSLAPLLAGSDSPVHLTLDLTHLVCV